MKRLLLSALLWAPMNVCVFSQPHPEAYPHDIHYFLPGAGVADGAYAFDPQVPEPKAYLGFEIGQRHADWQQVAGYMQTLAASSNRVSTRQFGQTNQFRPFIQVLITSEKNQKNLESIREEHLRLADADYNGTTHPDRMPVVVNLMYSMHGNEPSGVNSSLVLAYYLAALEGEEIEALLDNVVVALTPGLNPDGINRFASWVNSSRSYPDAADLSSREFAEPWPSSRTNHYWADCNRDWLMAQHPEGQNALNMYFEWMPHVVCDFHEQGGDRTYYFSPGDARRTHPLTPALNQELTARLTSYAARSLDRIGTLYYSKERYDDYYYGKGAAYGDIHGSVCILFEQLAARGHLRPTMNYGLMSFASTIRNQVFSGLSILQGACEMKDELLAYRRDYYRQLKKEAAKSPVQGYVFHARGSQAIAYHFLENMQHHRIDVYRLAQRRTIEGVTYDPADAYVIPVHQKHAAMVQTIMENVTDYADSTFYDISTWTFPHAYNLRYAALKTTDGLLGEKVAKPLFPQGKVIGGRSSLAYLFDHTQYYTPKLINELLKRGLIVKVSSKPITCPFPDGPVSFGYGTILVQTQNQPIDKDELFDLMSRLAAECGVDVFAMEQGLMTDYDLGTPWFTPLRLPRIAILAGPGMGVPESGEVWMLLNQRFQIAPTLIDYTTLPGVDMDKYNVLVMAGGSPSRALSQTVTDNLKRWVEKGGTLIATGSAYTWTNKVSLTDLKTYPTPKDNAPGLTAYRSYASRSGANAGHGVEGVILNCRLDLTHPLGWGYSQEEIAVFRTGALAFQPAPNPYASPLSYLEQPYLSGCISGANLQRIAGSPAVVTESYGKGRVIVFADDPNFRMYWYGMSKVFMNAVLFGQLL
ncbi:MAG: peptidase M14 [Tannerellaceae bacterium]|jgi:hypothetical protein|nr:peptidase M14 [Tannerellaceae bacterium]